MAVTQDIGLEEGLWVLRSKGQLMLGLGFRVRLGLG